MHRDREAMTDTPSCWCGNADLLGFSPGYRRCPACETLVSTRMPGPEIARVTDESRDLYGRDYWFSHQEATLGLPNILARSRSDLPERCLHWLRAILRYRRPPGRVLELGSGHGGFVALLRWAGFDATGLEISPWVVAFARETFEVPVLLGPLEDQSIPPGSLDVIALLDVLEHLGDPLGTMRHCLEALRPDGLLLVQTPCYLEGHSCAEMTAENPRYGDVLLPDEHLYLFSRRSIADLFARLGAAHIAFEPAIFAYDMFAVVGRTPVGPTAEGAELAPGGVPASRLVQALLDLAAERDGLTARYAEAEADRAARLEIITQQGRRLGEVEAERSTLAAEMAVQCARLADLEAIASARAEQVRTLMAHLRTLQDCVHLIQHGRVGRLMRGLGRWKFLDQVTGQTPPPPPATGPA